MLYTTPVGRMGELSIARGISRPPGKTSNINI